MPIARSSKKSNRRGDDNPRLSPSKKAQRLAALVAGAVRSHKDVEEDAPKRKKKKGKRRSAVDMIDGSLPKKERELLRNVIEEVEDESEDEIKSIFEGVFNKLGDAAGNPDAEFRGDDSAKNLQRAAYALMLDMIPIAESTYRATRKQQDAYAMNSFIDEARQLVEELRTMTDADNQTEHITKRIILPLMLRVANVLLNEFANLKGAVDTEVRDIAAAKAVKRASDGAALSIGKFMTEVQNAIAAQVAAYLHGDSNSLQLPPTRRRRNKSRA